RNGTNVGLPKFVDPILKVEDLIRFAKSRDTSIYKGIRIYPGLTANNEFIMIGCLGIDTNSIDERDYRIFNKTDFTTVQNPFPQTELPPPNDARTLNSSYTSFVTIYGVSQIPEREIDRISRFYYWKEIKNLLASNILNFDWNNENSYIGYKIKLESGYTVPEIADIFHQLSPAGNRNNHIGFTCIFHVIDRFGNDLIDPMQSRVPGNLNNYRNLYLEVGHPCPPRCGVLHQ
ncbi:MAG TPA: hypothetical protein PKD91_05230, partial [Bacteroidia bacterium]|nr:hypothetical protein [Bacteroidia bacterium]